MNLFFVCFIVQQVEKFSDEILGYIDQTTNWAVKAVRINLCQDMLFTTLVILLFYDCVGFVDVLRLLAYLK